MSKVYVPEDFIQKPCVEIYAHNIIRVYDKKPALNSDSTYTDFYTDMDYYSKSGSISWGSWSVLPVCVSKNDLVSDVYHRIDFPDIMITFFILLLICFYFPYRIISRSFGRWFKW